ncbi:T9SS type A sorting domain-containing protein [bacterium]|nr:T9SS type A sorting domain-containing protein [bacterium]
MLRQKSLKYLALLAVFVVYVCPMSSSAETIVSGEVSGTWALENSPYIVESDIFLSQGQFLAIQAGVEVRFAPATRFAIRGGLQVNGSEDNHVTFRGFNPGDTWDGLRIHDAFNENRASIDFAEFNDCLYGIEIRNSQATISSTNIEVTLTEIPLSIYAIKVLLSPNVVLNKVKATLNSTVSNAKTIVLSDSYVDMINCVVELNVQGIHSAGDVEGIALDVSSIVGRFEGNHIRASAVNSELIGMNISRGEQLTMLKNSVSIVDSSNTVSHAVQVQATPQIMLERFTIFMRPTEYTTLMYGVSSLNGSSVQLVNSIISSPIDGKAENSIAAHVANAQSYIFIDYCDLYNLNIPESPNIVINNAVYDNPQFSDLSTFELGPTSPCIDAGSSVYSEDDPDNTPPDLGMQFYFQMTAVPEAESMEIPSEISISSIYPNPFNSTARVEFTLASPGRIIISAYNTLGIQVDQLVSARFQAGTHTVVWNTEQNNQMLSNGIYFLRAESANKTVVQKVTLLK